MRLLFALLTSMLLLVNLGCVHQLAKVPKSTKQCLAQCNQSFKSCSTLCVNNCATCSAKANRDMIENYSEYVHEERVEGGYVMRRLKSYRDPLQCRKVSCNCSADLSICEQSCTGVIHKQLRAVPYCT